MKVKNTHFLQSAPFQPIYEMENGDIRLPFKNSEDGSFGWFTSEEALRMFVKTREQKEHILALFNDVKTRIGKKLVFGIGKNPVAETN